ncbi:PREDICTED: LOW QUALITY PROTEIN: P-selectin [Acanthisitta chloris]|uniref:LOW QUALITY PROTEIN: P-selectin n=1 Tax=Acanthisitta chloris TaxID=57068 RepID=UPI0004F0E2A7|nr:PREDICTED: LOW QUALITY PROTEIN: P-selectin [Acanthisitta chloris]
MVLWVEVGAWTYHYSDQGDYMWEQARNYCQTFFTDLVAIQNKLEIEYLNRTLPFHARYYWIGIRKLGGTWTWVGTRKALTKEAENWAVGEPNNRRSNQDCVEMYIKRPRESGKWNDEPCSRRKKALCYRASCQPFSCSQHGECVETIGSYRCECYPGFHGPECEDVVQCAKLEPKGVHMNCSHPYKDFGYNSTCFFECQEGFKRQGAAMLQCLPSQQWSANTPMCTAVLCPLLAGPKRGWVNWSHTYTQGMFTNRYLWGFSITCPVLSPESRECTATGTWTGNAAHCEAITCPVLSIPDWGELNCSHLHGHFSFGSTCAFSCPDWGELNCSHLHGDFSFGSTCTFSCQTGFALVGSDSRKCTATGTWTGDATRCEAIACSVLSAPDQGEPPEQGELNCSHLHGNFTFGSTCAFSCQRGFVLMGAESRECTAMGTDCECMATGVWTGDTPRCEAVACPVLSAPDRGELNCSHPHRDFGFGSTCAFSCQTGFALVGSDSHKCTATGTWTGDATRCEAIKCSALTTPKMGQAACSHPYGDFTFGSTCAFSCQMGFVLMGPESIECTAMGTWTGDTPQCKAISCPVLDPPSRGQLSCSHVHGNFTYNSTCTFSCEEGFVRMGAEVLWCEATGNWTSHPPVCAEDGAFLKEVLAYSSGTALAVAGVVLSGGLIALLVKRLSEREEKKRLLNPTSDLGSPGTFTNAAYDANL